VVEVGEESESELSESEVERSTRATARTAATEE
jgi:hypothetical protein